MEGSRKITARKRGKGEWRRERQGGRKSIKIEEEKEIKGRQDR